MDILLLGTGPHADAGAVALSLAGGLARAGRKAVVIDAAGRSGALAAAAPQSAHIGLGEVVAGSAGFGDAIHPDPNSLAHLVPRGVGDIMNAASWPRLDVVFDALGLTYDFVLAVGPTRIEDDPALSRLARRCRAAVLVSAGAAESPATQAAYQRLIGDGINDIVVLTTPPPAPEGKAAPARA
jgi:Mrp family chromosome partitioning ATPase